MSVGDKDPRPPAPPEAEARPAAPDVRPTAAPSVPDATSRCRELERLAVPERSLFEDAGDATSEALRGVHRANPLSVLVEAVKLASGLVTPLVLARMGRILSGDAAAVFQVLAAAAIIFVACLALSLAVWRARTWELAEREVVLRRGLGWGPFSRRCLSVPYEHIHTVTVRSELLERLFGLITLDLDTGAADAEGDATRLRGLRAGEAEALRAELFRRKSALTHGASCASGEKNPQGADAPADPSAPAPAGPAEERPLATRTLTGRQLALAAASQTSAVTQAAALVVLLAQGLNQLMEWHVLDLTGTGDDIAAVPPAVLVPVVAGFVLAALLLGAVVSFALNLVRYGGYRLARYPDRIVVEHGLLSRSSRAVVLGRIQYLSVRQGIFRQLLGYAEVRAVVVAAAGEGDGEPAGLVTLHPFLALPELEVFLAEVLPDFAGVTEALRLRRLPRVARRRSVVRAVIWWPVVAALMVGAAWLAGVSGLAERAAWLARPLLVLGVLLLAGLLVALVVDALRSYQAARYGNTARHLVLVSGGLTRESVIVPRGCIQHLQASASPLQRRARLATVSARTAASTTDGLSLRDLPADAADELLAWLRPRR